MNNKITLIFFSLIAGAAATCIWWNCCNSKAAPSKKQTHTLFGIGYVRGSSRVVLKNKYAGFVSRVNVYSQNRVKKGDIILTYDDFDIRKKISDKKHEILMQKETVSLKELALQLKKLDPLPSYLRNLKYKHNSAQALFSRLKHEEKVYDHLYKEKCISDLSLREKKQSLLSSEAELKQITEDQKILHQGLTDLYIKTAEQELQSAKQHLSNLEQDLLLLEEEQKYYRIVAPIDGLCITESDVVHGYNSAGTAAAAVHKDQKKLIYAYFSDDDVGFIKEGVSCIFQSSQYPGKDGIFKITPYEIKKDRSSYGNRCYYLVKFRVCEEHKPLRIESVGRVEITVN